MSRLQQVARELANAFVIENHGRSSSGYKNRHAIPYHQGVWEVDFEAMPEGPFYRPRRLGEQKRLIINTEHPFYTKIYNATPAVQPSSWMRAT